MNILKKNDPISLTIDEGGPGAKTNSLAIDDQSNSIFVFLKPIKRSCPFL